MPVLTQPVLSEPPFALGFVFVQKLWRRQRRLLKLVSRLVVLPRVPLALAGGDHSDFIRSCAAVLALQLDALGAGLVVDASKVLTAAPPAPELPAVGATDPILKHLSWKAFASTHKLLDGVDAGAVAIRDVLSGSQLSASNLAPFSSLVRRTARASPAVPRAVQRHVALKLRYRRAHLREEQLRGVVFQSLTAPQQDEEDHQGVTGLVRAQLHGCGRVREAGCREGEM